MRIKFCKMHGLGNDFVVLDRIRQDFELSPELLKTWGDRHFGIGFDQLLLVEKPEHPDNDFRYRIFNCDGSEVQQCGNGARCFARFVLDQGLTDKKLLRVETARGVIEPEILDNGMVRVNMGTPKFSPESLPFLTDEGENLSYHLDLEGDWVDIGIVSMGNPHAVQLVDDVELAPVQKQGEKIESHPQFPERVNAGFMQVLDRQNIALRVFERGAGETLACGTGACAAVVTGIRRGWLDANKKIRVQTRGGELWIEWSGEEGQAVLMTGPAVTVFHGDIDGEQA